MDSDNILGGSVGNDDSTKANRGGVAGGSNTNLNALGVGGSASQGAAGSNPFGEVSGTGIPGNGAMAGRSSAM